MTSLSVTTAACVRSVSSQYEYEESFLLNETDLPDTIGELVKELVEERIQTEQKAIEKEINDEVERRLALMAPSKAVTNQQILDAVSEQADTMTKLLQLQTQILADQKCLFEENEALRKENAELRAQLDRLEQPQGRSGDSVSGQPLPQLRPSAGFASPFTHSVPSVPTLPPPFPPFRPPGHGPLPPVSHRPYGSPPPPPTSSPPMAAIVSKILEEQKERETKSRNVAVIGMDDSAEDSLGTALAPNTDFTTISSCLDDLGIDGQKLVSVVRVGDRSKARNMNRLLMVVFADTESKEAFADGFLNVSKAVRKNAAYVREDLTVLQRQERSQTAHGHRPPSFTRPSLLPVNWLPPSIVTR